MFHCNIKDYGARGDGITVNTGFIQRAINVCYEHGGGMVTVPPGDYLSGSVILKSNVHFFLEEGSRIIASLDRNEIIYDEDFQDPASGFLIGAIDASNISISGYGQIDGQGDQLMEADDGISEYPLLPSDQRTKLCYFRGCRNLNLKEVTFRKSSQWTVHLIGCQHVRIDGVNIFNNLRGANNDGIDPDCCRDVRISNCYIEGGDDAIVIKTTEKAARQYGNCEDVIVSHCNLVSRGSAIKIGTETHADIRNCLFSHCIVKNSNRGVGIWVRDGGMVENIIVSDLILETRMFKGAPQRDRVKDWWGKGEPIFFSVAYRSPKVYPGKIRKVIIRDVIAEAENSLFIKGLPESYLENIVLDSICLFIRRRSGLPGGVFDEQPPEDMVYPHHTPAVYGKCIKNLTINQMKIEWGTDKSEHWSNAVYGENIDNFLIRNLTGCSAGTKLPVVELNHVQGFSIKDCSVPKEYLLIHGKDVNGHALYKMN